MGILNSSNTFSDNDDDYVLLDASTQQAAYVRSNVTLPALDVPYAIQSEVELEAEWTVEAGTEFVMPSNASIYVNGYEGGVFRAKGTSSKPIVFNGQQNTAGFWDGIGTEYGGAIYLKYCEINDGGDQGLSGLTVPKGVIQANSIGGAPTLSIKNCTITNSPNHGISIGGSTQYNTDIETSNTFSDITGDNVHFY